MRAIGILCLAASLCFPAGAASAADTDDVPFQLIDNRVFVPVQLNGSRPFQFILDTGAPGWGIADSVLAELRLPTDGSETSSGAGEHVEQASTLHVASVRLGNLDFRDQKVIAQKFTALNDVIGFRTFDGVAGKPVFDGHVVDIDFAANRLSILPAQRYVPPPGAGIVPFQFYPGFIPEVEGRIAGIDGRFIVDLGDRSSLTLFGPFWRRHGIDKKLAPVVEALTGYGIGGPIQGLVTRVRDFTFGTQRVTDVVARLSLQKSGGFADPNIAGSIGTGILKRFRIAFDYPNKRIVLVPREHIQSDGFDRAGIWLGRHGDQFEFFDVIARSPAAQAGLRVGDIVTQVDGKAASQIDLFALREHLKDARAQKVTFAYRRGDASAVATLQLRDLLSAPD